VDTRPPPADPAPIPLPQAGDTPSGIVSTLRPDGCIVTRNNLGQVFNVIEPPHPQYPSIFIYRWQGFILPQEIYDLLSVVALPLMQARSQTAKILNDISQVTGPWDEAAEPLLNDIVPRLVAQGLRHAAVLLSADAFARYSAETFADEVQAKGFYVTRRFEAEAPALDWLRQQ